MRRPQFQPKHVWVEFLVREAYRHGDGLPHREWRYDVPYVWQCCGAVASLPRVYYDSDGNPSAEDKAIVRAMAHYHRCPD